VEQLLRLGVALPGGGAGGFRCTVNAPPAMLATPLGTEAGGAGLRLSLAQEVDPGGGIAATDTWAHPPGCGGSSNGGRSEEGGGGGGEEKGGEKGRRGKRGRRK